MSTDRELLELAAKAAGMQLLPKGRWSDDAAGWFYNEHGGAGMFYRGASAPVTRWNPLTDDGDAFRLAVKLRLLVDFSSCCAMNLKNSDDDWFGGVLDDARIGCSPDEVDGSAATRRAIVRAAADLANQGTQA